MTGDEVQRRFALIVESGRRWLYIYSVIPVVLLAIQLVFFRPLNTRGKHHQASSTLLVLLVLMALFFTWLAVFGLPLLIKKGFRSTVSKGLPSLIDRSESRGGLYGPGIIVAYMISPATTWPTVGFIYSFVGGNTAVSVAFYIVGFIYLAWFRLTMDARYEKLGTELGEIAEELQQI